MIDAHVHLNCFAPEVVDIARRAGRRLYTINVELNAFGPIEDQAAVGRAYLQADPAHFSWIATFSTRRWGAHDWAARTIRWLEDCFANGAIGVKIWKNIGLALRDEDGSFVLPDDPRLDVVTDCVRRHRKLVVLHTADPHGCWQPLEQIQIEGDREYYQEHPEHHMHGRSDVPTSEELLLAAERFLARNRDLVTVGAHLLSLDHDLPRLEALLETYPNLYVDTAGRMEHLKHHARRDETKMKTVGFVQRHWRRIRYGSDLSFPKRADFDRIWEDDWQWFRRVGLGREEIEAIHCRDLHELSVFSDF